MHAFGERFDSPVPLWLFVTGGASVVLLSFLMVRNRAVPDPASADPRVVDVVPPRSGPLARAVSVTVLALLVLAGLLGTQEVSENLLPTVFWLVVWVALPLLSGVVGDFTGPLNPFAALAELGDRPALRRLLLGRRRPLTLPAGAGWWLSAGFFFVLVLGELVVNDVATLPWVSASALAGYGLVCLLAGAVVGAPAWNSRAEVFTVTMASWGRLGWFRFRAPGRDGFARGLATPFEARPGRLVGVLLLLVAVAFDGLLSTPQWGSAVARLPQDVQTGSPGFRLLATAVLVALLMATVAVFGSFARGSGSSLLGLAPSLLPIAFGYELAHYLQYVVINGQLLFPLLGNPIGSPGWPIHLPYPFNDDYEVATGIMPTWAVWYVQIVVIVLAHIVAVVLAHHELAPVAGVAPTAARASVAAPTVARRPRRELPWLAAMVGYTMLSLWLLAQPLMEQASTSAAGLP